MEPRIQNLEGLNFVGIFKEMSIQENKTNELFSTFMPRRNEIINLRSKNIFDLRIYPVDYFNNFDPKKTFTKWAAMEVINTSLVPPEMHPIVLKEGLYAIFSSRGFENENSFFEYIYTKWLPHSEYVIDNRPHFEIFDQNSATNLNQESWIPVKLKDN